MAEPGSITELIGRLKCGDRNPVEPLWNRYFPCFVRLARKTLSGRLKRAADEEDAALSAFTTLWRDASAGEFPPNRPAAKRGGGAVLAASELAELDVTSLQQAMLRRVLGAWV